MAHRCLAACHEGILSGGLELFSRFTLPATLHFLQTYPTLELQEPPVPELATFLKAHRHPRSNLTAQRIYAQLYAPQLEARPAVAWAKSRFMLVTLAQLEPLLEAIKDYDEEITRLFKSHPDSLISASPPGVGIRLAPQEAFGVGQ